ncbi:DUF2975 domain-containing protein [Nonomuraea sp. NPDC046570]|uniref:DUF2975 domain-containing protein n=1 Tax=Nonomuraea sp. NPDC046570 TaxID=3155255 RepID=UPI0033C96D27
MPHPPIRWLTRLETLFSVGLVLGLLGCAARLLATGFVTAGFGSGFGVDLLAPEVQAVTQGLLAPGVEVVGTRVTVTVLPGGPSAVVGALDLLSWLPGTVTWLLAVYHLIRALRRGRAGDRALFSTVTADHLRRIGWILIIGTLVSGVLEMVAKPLLSTVLLTRGYPFHIPSTNLAVGLVTGCAALAVAEIVRRGLRLLEDVEATI